MNPWWLLVIVPFCVTLGFVGAFCLVAVAGMEVDDDCVKRENDNEGYR